MTYEAERLRFIEEIKRHVEEQLPGLSAEDVEEEVDRHFWPEAVACLAVGTGAEAHDILVSRLMFTSKGPTGRSTRGSGVSIASLARGRPWSGNGECGLERIRRCRGAEYSGVGLSWICRT